MDILVVGLSHKTSPVELREKLAFSEEEVGKAYSSLIDYQTVREALILSTCNRVEVYSWANAKGKECIISWLEKERSVPKDALLPYLYAYEGEEAVRHIFRVASSLDSMVLGEPQIVGQVKDSFEIAMNLDATGIILNQLMKKAVSVSKKVRTETGIGGSAVSVSYAAVELAKKIFGALEKRKAMLVGAGEMAELAAMHLVSHGISGFLVANRTFSRAQEMAESLGGEAIPMEKLSSELTGVDIVITSTGAQEYIITKEMVQRAIKGRKMRPIFFIDIAVPRNVDPAAERVENVYIYDIDDLEQVVQENRKRREKEADRAEVIVEEEVGRFMGWLRSQEVVPVIVSLRSWCQDIRKHELEKTLARLKPSEKEIEALEALTSSIVNKILHPPLSYIKDAASRGEGEKTARMIKDIFALEDRDEDKDRNARK
jgi:glutamyl-tRNA reductase